VCLGNICRSPAAEAVLRQLLDEAGMTDLVEVDSAGTARYHVGDRPDPRTLAEAARRGIPIDHRARQLTRDELSEWDVIIAMDAHNLRDLRAMASAGGDLDHLRLLRSFDPSIGESGVDADVPDPYYGEDEGFSEMFDLIEPACRGLVEHLQTLVVRQ
jgi:protein-tyrosine phosphatase